MLGRACRLSLVVAFAPLLLVAVGRATPAGATSGPLPPDRDPFYTYSGGVPLKEIPPGTVLTLIWSPSFSPEYSK